MLIDELRKFSIEDARIAEEFLDEQFLSLKELYSEISDKDIFPILVVLNALISYQLTGTGEMYWDEFSKYFSNACIEDPIESMIKFLEDSKFNRRLHLQKKRRIKKMENVISILIENQDEFYQDMVALRDLLAKVMNQSKSAKTIVFSVKMFGYAMRIKSGKFIPYPYEIDIPLDSRIKRISETLGVEDPLSFWREVSTEIKIPPLHIDSLLWISKGDLSSLRKRIDDIKRNYSLSF